ncbi:DUF7519 family protein [Natronoglomus mannanivorans]|uniref:Uncharacterized protein n=1 Tax=Natronoglomus mannanivorans TaxID=2979990 RepID=A0AAP2Z1B9_9EURY|nr:hypothetical protein [Halobacteria archaeon AArc-xg1-1]
MTGQGIDGSSAFGSDSDSETAMNAKTGTDFGLLPTGIAAVTVFVIGASLGATTATVGALLAVGGLLTGLSLLSSESLATRALGSCVFVGGFALAGSVVLTGSPVAVGGVLAVGVTAVAVLSRTGRYAVVSQTCRDSAVLAVVVGVTLIALLEGVVGVSAITARSLLAVLTLNASVAAVSLLFSFAVTVVLLDLASSVLEPRLPDGVSLPSMVSFVHWVLDLPTGVFYVVAIVGFFALSADVSAAFESALVALGPVGTVVELALVSGLLHVAVALVALSVTAVIVGKAITPLVSVWLGHYPLRTLALGSGGAVVAALLVAATVAVPDVVAPSYPVALFGVLVLTSFFVDATEFVTGVIDLATPSRYALAFGVIALFATVTVGALEGVEPIVVFAGVAASILVWDLGENTLSMRTQLGDAVDTREPELVHATGSIAVGVLGVAVAATAMYVLGNVSPPEERWQALAPFVLALAAVFVLGLAVQRDFGFGAVLDRIRGEGFSQLPSRYPFVVGGSAVVLVCLSLIGLGYGYLVFFLLVILLPFALLVGLDWTTDSPHDYRNN